MLLTGLVLLFSCVKEYSYQQGGYEQDLAFFKRNASLSGFNKKINGNNTDEYSLNKIIEQFKNLDRQKHIVSGIKKQHGLALWDLSVIFKNTNGYKTIVTPLKRIDSDTTEALLFSYLENGKTRFKIVDAKAKHQRVNANGSMEAKEFTQSTVKGLYKACNESISRSKTYIQGSNQGSVNPNTVVIHWVCWNYYATYTDPSSGVVTAFATTVQCSYSITFTGSELEYLDPSYYNDPTGGGGGGSYIEDWTYINIPVQNQSIIDSLNGYPCAQQILANINDSIKSEVEKLLLGVFGVNSDINLTFKVDNTLNKDSLLNGYTATISGSGSGWYEQNIFLNPWVLQNSSKEFTATVFIHEGIHAVIDYWNDKYIRWKNNHNDPNGIDSTTFKDMFPIFWDYNRIRTPVELAEHEQMAASYVNKIADFVKIINPNVTDEMAEAIGWRGLQETTVWKSKADSEKNQILNLQRIARRDIDATNNQFSLYNLTKCD
jgi:hypothetical protein